MQKNFDTWNTIKKQTQYRNDIEKIFFREKEIWWCKLGLNVGDEQDGKGAMFQRPVLILKKFNQKIFFAVPITTKLKNNKYYIKFNSKDNFTRAAMISQTRLLDIHRLTEKMMAISEEEFFKIKKAIRDLFL